MSTKKAPAKRKISTTKAKAKEKTSLLVQTKNLMADERFRFLLSIVMLASSVYVLVAFVSFLFTWKADQSYLDYGFFDYMSSDIMVENWAGKTGAALSNLFIFRWFGIASFGFVFLMVLSGLELVNVKLLSLRESIKNAVFGVLWTSITLSYFFADNYLFLGGSYGYFISNWLEGALGMAGTFFILFIAIIGFVIFTFENAFFWLKNFILNYSSTKTLKKAVQSASLSVKQKEVKESVEKAATQEETPIKKAESVAKKETFQNFIPQNKVIDMDTNEPLQMVDRQKFTLDDSGKKIKKKEAQNDLGFEVNDTKENLENKVTEAAEKLDDKLNDRLALDVEHNQDIEADVISTLPDEVYDPTLELSNYRLPSIDLLEDHRAQNSEVTKEELISNKNKIVETLKNFKIDITKIKAMIGPTITLYEIIPAAGVRISKIKNLEDDIALSLAALGIRIIAPMPGRGTIGIEVPNQKPEIVSMRSVISSTKFQESKMELPIALGKTISNESYVVDLTKMPHLLVAGATGQGKSVGLNVIIASLLYKKHPAHLKFVFVDPKKVELTLYEKIEKHFLAKLPESEEAIITDNNQVVNTLGSLNVEMDNRYNLLKKAQVRNIKEYNAKFIARRLNPEKGHLFLPYIVLVIDEFADLIMTAGKEVELPLARLAQLARAIGIHLIVATQRPSTNIITGVIKANFPTRLAFKVASMIDSRTILDSPGANQLIGRGDMLISEGSDLVRLQCAFVDTPELDKITAYIHSQQSYTSAMILPDYSKEEGESKKEIDLTKRDELFDDAARLIVMHQQGSTSLIQRKMSIGYNRAGRIIDQLEAAGIVGKYEGSKARQVLYSDEYSLEQFLTSLNN